MLNSIVHDEETPKSLCPRLNRVQGRYEAFFSRFDHRIRIIWDHYDDTWETVVVNLPFSTLVCTLSLPGTRP